MTVGERLMGRVLGEASGVNHSVFKVKKSRSVLPFCVSLSIFIMFCAPLS